MAQEAQRQKARQRVRQCDKEMRFSTACIVYMSSLFSTPNGQDNRRTGRASGLIVGLGRLGEVPDTRPTERTTLKEYHLRLPERDVSAMPNIERTQRKKMKAA